MPENEGWALWQKYQDKTLIQLHYSVPLFTKQIPLQWASFTNIYIQFSLKYVLKKVPKKSLGLIHDVLLNSRIVVNEVVKKWFDLKSYAKQNYFKT